MMKSRLRLILILAVALAVVVGGYFLLTRVILDSGEETPPADPPVVLANGEYYVPSANRYAIYPYLSASNIMTMTVENSESDTPYTIAVVEKNGKQTYCLTGYEGLDVQGSLVTVVTAKIASPNYSARITDGSATDTVVYANGQSRAISLKQYGLDAESHPTRVTFTDTAGTTHTLYIGNETPLGDGYYCRYADANGIQRKEVYVVDTMFGYFTLAKEAYLNPILVQTNASQNLPYLPEISIVEKGDPNGKDLNIKATLEIGNYGKANTDLYTLVTGGKSYGANVSVLTNICTDFISLSGTQVVKLLPTLAENETFSHTLAQQVYEQYGVKIGDTTAPEAYRASENRYVLTYALSRKNTEEDTGFDFDLFLMFSDKRRNEAGKEVYYVYTTVVGADAKLYYQIVEADADLFYYLEQDAAYFVNRSVYSNNIGNIQSVSYQGQYRDHYGTMHAVNETFTLQHLGGTDTEDETDAYFAVYCGSGYQYNADNSNNFSLLYLITIYNPEYIGTVSPEEEANKEHFATITIQQTDGVTKTFAYYRVSSSRLAVSVDGGACEFTVMFNSINEIMANVPRAAQGLHPIISVTSELASTPGFEAR